MKRRLPLIALVAGLSLASALPERTRDGTCAECTPISCPPTNRREPARNGKKAGLGGSPKPTLSKRGAG